MTTSFTKTDRHTDHEGPVTVLMGRFNNPLWYLVNLPNQNSAKKLHG